MDAAVPGVVGERRVGRLAAHAALGAIVLGAALLHVVLALRRATPGYFPDEYMYAELGRSLLESGTPLVREHGSGMLALLAPLLTAPAWLWDDVAHAYRTIQVVNASVMALAAVPAYLLARRLGAGRGLALTGAGLTVATPELLYAGAILAEPLAYTLSAFAALAVVRALERPTLLNQGAVLALGGLAAATRMQLAIIPLCYGVAVLVSGIRAGALRTELRRHRAGLVATVAGGGAALAAGLLASLGLYGSLTAYRVPLAEVVPSLGVNALVLAYAAGWAIVPAALLGGWLALRAPLSGAELALGGYAVAFLPLLLFQASAFGDVGRVQERYAIYALPVAIALFVVYARRGWPLLRAHAMLAALLAVAASLVPLAGYAAAGGGGQSLFLAALTRLESLLGDVGLASLLVALAGTALSALVLATAWLRPRWATPAAVAATIAVAGLVVTGASAQLEDRRAELRAAYLPADPSWVDAAASGDVVLLATPRSSRADLHTTLFWNRSIDQMLLLGDTRRPDPFSSPRARVDGAGTVSGTEGELVLTDHHGSWVELRGAELLGSAPTKKLWRSPAGVQLSALMTGRYYTGAVATEGAFRVWPQAAGGPLSARLELELSLPGAGPAVGFAVTLPNGRLAETDVAPGSSKRLSIPVCGRGVWTAPYASGSAGLVHGTRVGVVATEPRLVADPSACG